MRHCDDETLSLLALGEPASAQVDSHLAGCPQCAAELAGLRRVVTTARTPAAARVGASDNADSRAPRIAPPPMLWQQIAAATGVSTDARHSEVLRHSALLQPDPVETAPAAAEGEAQTGKEDQPPLLPRRSRLSPVDPPVRSADSAQALAWLPRPSRPALLLAAACLAIGVIGGVTGTRLIGDDATPSSQVVAATSLAGLKLAPSAIGRADVVSTDGGRTLDLDVQRLAVPEGFYEVWLIDSTVTKMVPIGVLSGSSGHFTLPPGVDLRNYPVVDISIQPLNGDPKHSGRSVLRGTFTT